MDKVVHFEIPADELERAQKFYKSVFSWEMNAVPGMVYIMLGTTPSNENGMPQEPGAINGGMMKCRLEIWVTQLISKILKVILSVFGR